MKFSTSFFALAASFAIGASALSLGDIPSCASSCFMNAVSQSGCGITDTSCMCTTGQSTITSSVASCAPAKCSPSDLAKIAPAVEKICANSGHSITIASSVIAGATAAASGAQQSGASATTTQSGTTQSSGAAVANIAGVGAAVMGVFAAVAL